MKTSMYGQISLTKLGEIAKKHPALVKEVTFKDGHKEKILNISILVNDQEDGFGNIGAIRVDCKQSEQIAGLKYFAGNLKKSKFQDQQPAQQGNWDAPLPPIGDDDSNNELPF